MDHSHAGWPLWALDRGFGAQAAERTVGVSFAIGRFNTRHWYMTGPDPTRRYRQTAVNLSVSCNTTHAVAVGRSVLVAVLTADPLRLSIRILPDPASPSLPSQTLAASVRLVLSLSVHAPRPGAGIWSLESRTWDWNLKTGAWRCKIWSLESGVWAFIIWSPESGARSLDRKLRQHRAL